MNNYDDKQNTGCLVRFLQLYCVIAVLITAALGMYVQVSGVQHVGSLQNSQASKMQCPLKAIPFYSSKGYSKTCKTYPFMFTSWILREEVRAMLEGGGIWSTT